MEEVRNSKTLVMPFSDILKLLRIPFSIFLLPVFLFALTPVANPIWLNVTLLFILLHFFIYPASNAYNSYMDQDTESIGGLEKPPTAGRETYYISLILDALALFVAGCFSTSLAIMLAVYSVISRLYSWRVTRLKKYPWISFAIVSLFQGGYTYMLSNMYFTDTIGIEWFNESSHGAGFIASTFMVAAFYPLTQIYQHDQDIRNGDKTISYMMGIKGTFILSALSFSIALLGLWNFFNLVNSSELFYILMLFILPVLYTFIMWARKCWKNHREANFINTMKMNKVSSAMLIGGFITIWMMM